MGKVLLVLFGFVLATAGVLFLLWVLWLLWKRSERTEEEPAVEFEIKAPPVAAELPAKVTKAPAEAPPLEALPTRGEPLVSLAPDDLKVIEGIGPKIASVLQAAGIATFAQLADAEVSRLQQILETADPRLLRLADPKTWPEQASLAAAGAWEALEALQNQLKGGRRA